MSETTRTEANEDPDAPEGMRCDFCGQRVPQVRRVALDEGYDRLQKKHAVQYACPECSAAKERERLARQE